MFSILVASQQCTSRNNVLSFIVYGDTVLPVAVLNGGGSLS